MSSPQVVSPIDVLHTPENASLLVKLKPRQARKWFPHQRMPAIYVLQKTIHEPTRIFFSVKRLFTKITEHKFNIDE